MQAESWAFGPTGGRREKRAHARFRLVPRSKWGKGVASFLISSMLVGGGAFAAWFNSQTVSTNGYAKFVDQQTVTGVVSGVMPAYASIAGTLSPGDTGKANKVTIDTTGANTTGLKVIAVNTRSGSLSAVAGSPGTLCSDVANAVFESGEFRPMTVGEGGSGKGVTTHSQTGLSLALGNNTTTEVTVTGYLDVSTGISDTCASQAFRIPVNVVVGQ
jgi:hypothetical protein